MPKTALQFIDSLDDPDNVGASEYRAVHELLADAIASDDELELKTVDTILDELIGWANKVKADLATFSGEKK